MRVLLMLSALLLIALPHPAEAARRALVIGIDTYTYLPPLDKAAGDADAVAAKLSELGFEVSKAINPGRRAFNQAISSFQKSLHKGDIALVHFSGHGVEVKGHNLLLPSDVPIPRNGEEDFLIGETFDLDVLMDRVASSGASVRLFVIDACRNNPFLPPGARATGQTGGLGLSAASEGSFVLYSAGFRQIALDRLGPGDESPTSVYTRVLVEQLDVPGVTISQLARNVRAGVSALAASAGYRQSPAYYDELTHDFVLNPNIPETSVSAGDVFLTAEAFNQAREVGTPQAWDVFLRHYPEGVFADLARSIRDHALTARLEADVPPVQLTRVEARRRLNELWDYGDRLAIAGDREAALQKFEDGLVLSASVFGRESLEFADANNRIIGPLSDLGQIEDAISASRAAIAAYSAVRGVRHPNVLNEKANLAGRLALTGEVKEAIAIYEDVLKVYDKRKLTDSDKLLYASALQGLSEVYGRLNDAEKVKALAEQAVAVMEEAQMPSTVLHGAITLNYAKALLGAGKCEQAKTALIQAQAHMEFAGVLPSQHDFTQILELRRRGCG